MPAVNAGLEAPTEILGISQAERNDRDDPSLLWLLFDSSRFYWNLFGGYDAAAQNASLASWFGLGVNVPGSLAHRAITHSLSLGGILGYAPGSKGSDIGGSPTVAYSIAIDLARYEFNLSLGTFVDRLVIDGEFAPVGFIGFVYGWAYSGGGARDGF